MKILLVNILAPIACILIGYIIGSANISIPVGKLLFKQDPREYGSHNVGATNCGRLWGKKWFWLIFLFDTLKTIAPLYLCWSLLTYVPIHHGHGLMPDAYNMYIGNVDGFAIKWPVYWLACLGALLGNVFPLFLKFKGGKAASTYLGLTFTTSWGLTSTGVITYLICIFKTKYVSFSSIICGIENAIASWVWAILLMCKVIPAKMYWFILWGPMFYCNYVFAIVMTIIVIVMVFRHHENIARIKAGTERKVHWVDQILHRKNKVEN